MTRNGLPPGANPDPMPAALGGARFPHVAGAGVVAPPAPSAARPDKVAVQRMRTDLCLQGCVVTLTKLSDADPKGVADVVHHALIATADALQAMMGLIEALDERSDAAVRLARALGALLPHFRPADVGDPAAAVRARAEAQAALAAWDALAAPAARP